MIAQVHPCDMQRWLDDLPAGARPVLLDVREPHELALASVAPAGLTLLAIPMGQIPARLAELDPTQVTACLCHHGMRSMQVANFLQARGFAQLVNIRGGIHAWAVELDHSIPVY